MKRGLEFYFFRNARLSAEQYGDDLSGLKSF